MIIGYNLVGGDIFDFKALPVLNSTYVEIKNAVIDELHAQSTMDSSSTREGWGFGTVLLATFNGDLEAGNIQMRENPIDKLRIKRRNLKKQDFQVLNELDFTPEPTQIIYDDYTVSSNVDYEYVITPVDATGIEGIVTAVNVKPQFEGWWLVDPEDPANSNFQFFYNLDDVNIETSEDRIEISTFSKYPIVRYGQKRARKGSLSGLFIPEGDNVVEQYSKLDNMIKQRKKLLLKDGFGRNFYVDVSNPTETALQRPSGLSRISIDWVEVEEYID